ncbi:MAG: ferrous iron transport protein B [Cytophagaceae bacterium]|nr:ferrous iron transport protein B [Cytophagaceae bacterium]
MWIKKNLKIALLGNPNAGKSSLFNHLTGLNQKIGNFPGVTIDKKTGVSKLSENIYADIIDLPGIYSLYPKTLDERIVFDILNNPDDASYPDLIVVVVDASNLKRNLLLFTQIRDLGFPVILALNMLDLAEKNGVNINIEKLKKELEVPVVLINGRSGKGVDQLKAALACPIHNIPKSFLNPLELAPEVVGEIKKRFNISNDYKALQLAHQFENLDSITSEGKTVLEDICRRNNFDSVLKQSEETIFRYESISRLISDNVIEKLPGEKDRLSNKLDKALTHKIFGYLIFFFLLFLIFQAIFAWAALPMDWIDSGIATLNEFLQNTLPGGPLTDLLTEGLIAGLGGILIFIPQIAILFMFIAILEESGYMSRVMFIMDKIMRKVGMNGRSVVPLISGVACAVPAIMATRNIENWKERMITIFVTPFMSCSARIPVYTILIALVVPEIKVLGILNMQGLVLMALYLLGFVVALLSGWLLNFILKSNEKGYFIMEFPVYKIPRWKNVGLTIVEKVKAFVFGAGKIIIAISIILWVLASYGPGKKMAQAEAEVLNQSKELALSNEEIKNRVAAKKLEYSYAGYFGKTIEPVIKPLGFDWKIGIALITSFAAREVFIGTMSTIYSIGEDAGGDQTTIKEKMKAELNPETGQPFYTPALAVSLLLFYAFAMQCMSTLAIVYRETKGWKWPLLQFIFMTGLAYLSSYIAYQSLT